MYFYILLIGRPVYETGRSVINVVLLLSACECFFRSPMRKDMSWFGNILFQGLLKFGYLGDRES